MRRLGAKLAFRPDIFCRRLVHSGRVALVDEMKTFLAE